MVSKSRHANRRCWRVVMATLVAIGCATAVVAEGPGTILIPGRVAVSEGGALGLQSAQGGMSGFFVAREGGSAGAVSVDLDTVDGSALAEQDLAVYRATLTWEDGEDGVKEVPIEVFDDEDVEGNEWFGVRLSNVTGGARLPRRFARVVIRDDDFAVQPASLLAELASNPDSATDDQGRRLIAFEAPDADGLGIYAVLLSPDGERLKGPDLVNLKQAGDQVSPKVATVGDRPGRPTNTQAITSYWQRSFSVLWIERGEATPPLLAEEDRPSAVTGGGGTTVMRRFFDSDDGLADADTTEDLGWDLSGDFWGVVAGPSGLMAAFGCNAEGFAVGHILGQAPAGFEAEIAVSETPMPDCVAAHDASTAGRSAAAMKALRRRLGAVPKRSLGPITVAYHTSGATAGPVGRSSAAMTGGGLRARSFSWNGEPLSVEIHVTASATAANPAASISAKGRIGLFWDDIGEEGDRDIFGVIADDVSGLIWLGTNEGSLPPKPSTDVLTAPGGLEISTAARRIQLESSGDQRLAGAATNSNGDSFLALYNDVTSESGAPASVALLGVALDEDGLPVATSIPLALATDGEELTVSLDDSDGAIVSYLNAAGELEQRRVQASIARGACVADEHTLCLADERYAVSALWSTTATEVGRGHARSLTADTDTFWFFDEDNLEILIKVLDGCTINDRHWLFAAGLTDVGATLTVHDTATGEIRVYENGVGTPFAPSGDTDAFMGCPG